ncbi:AlpA family transcriptional regulator [Paraburkholderia sp.]|uniref:helix-turn-helix transcriptional regulator n=1 Tax=Paraburkholderia sp. TaxID=1926495 RepID=UPI0025F27E89|nr:AlpA family phage regulatory protein [Paraburkholderia sp.]
MAVKILRLSGVIGAIGVGKTTIYQWIKDGAFPAPVRLGVRSVGWRAADIDAWLEAREQVTRASNAGV